MNRRCQLAILLGLVLIVLAAAPAFPQEGRGLRVQGYIGASSSVEKNFELGFWSSIGFSIPVQSAVFLSFEFGNWNSAVTGRSETLLDGTLYVNPFLISVQYHMMPDKVFSPYLFLGGGYVFSRFNLGDIITIPEITLNQKIDSGPGGKLGAGIEIDLGKRLSIVGEVSYFFSRVKGETTIQDMNFGVSVEEFTFGLSALIVHVGLKYTIK